MSETSQFFPAELGRRRRFEPGDYAALMELMPHAALLVDFQSDRILFANPQTSELSGYTLKELVGANIHTLLPEWDKPASPDFQKAPHLPGNIQDFTGATTAQLATRNQSRRAVALTHILPEPGGGYYLIALQPYDDWGQPRQSHHLRFWESLNRLASAQQESNLSAAFEQALQAGSALAMANLLVIYQASGQQPQLKQSAGLGAYRLLPDLLPAQDLIHHNQARLWSMGKLADSALLRAARKARLPYLACAPIGPSEAAIGLVVVADTQAALPTDALPVAQLLAKVTDSMIQQHAQLDKALSGFETQARRLQTSAVIEEEMKEAVLWLDAALQVLKLNRAAELMLGYTSYDVAGRPVDSVLIGTLSLLPALGEAQRGSATYNLDNARLYRRNGEAFLARVRLFPVLQGAQVDQIIVLIQDLSEQEEMRRQAQEYEQRAILGEVTAIFAHEVRNPINNISTGLQWMALNQPQEDPNQEAIQRMLQDCDRLATLIKSVLAFSRPADYEMENLELSLLLERLLERLNPRITRLKICYELQIEPGCPLIRGNLRALEQVFSNLIQNALDAMASAGGRLGLKVQPVEAPGGRQYLQVSVADTGPGIPKELQERIFQPFVTTKKDGTGLGLAISKRIITAHKGNISLTSFPGGTLFQVQLPIADSPLAEGRNDL